MARTEKQPETEKIGGERRTDQRYGIALDLRWKLIRRKKILDTGTGNTVDLSSGGILFEPGRKLPVGLKVQLSIAWPVRLHGAAPLQLAVAGRIVRSDDNRAALQIIQHEFRTVGVPAESRNGMAMAARAPFAYQSSNSASLAK